MSTDEPHPICRQLRDLRQTAGMSLTELSQRCNVPAIVLGTWERGDRRPPLHKLEEVFNVFGYTVMAVATDRGVIRLPTDIANELRQIADQLESRQLHDLSALS